MTHSIDAPLPPPATTGSGSGAPSTTEKAKDAKDAAVNEAKNVSQTAKQAGSQVAATASDQAKEVVQETQRQAKDLLDQGRTQVKEQVVSQQQKAGQSLSSLAQELRALADGTSEGAPGPARDLLQQASSSVESFASMLQDKEPAELLYEVRRFARRKPGLFLIGAATVGVLAGRLTSGVKAAHTDSGPSANGFGHTNYVDPAPTYADTTMSSTYTGTGTGSAYSPAGTAAPLPPPPYGTVPAEGSMVPPATTTAGWDDPARRPGGVG